MYLLSNLVQDSRETLVMNYELGKKGTNVQGVKLDIGSRVIRSIFIQFN